MTDGESIYILGILVLKVCFQTCAVDVSITGDEDDAHGEDSEGVLVVKPEHHVIRPRVLDLGLPVYQLLRVLEEVVHLVLCHLNPLTSHKEARCVLQAAR